MNFKQMYVGIRLTLSVGDYRFNSQLPVPDSSAHWRELSVVFCRVGEHRYTTDVPFTFGIYR